MRRLALPTIDFSTALATSIEGIGDAAVRASYQAQIADPATIEAEYISHARGATLFSLPRMPDGEEDPVVHGTLRKSHFTKLYTQYFVPDTKPGRNLYNELKAAAKGKCPLCGDIGQAYTLDHYVPKANFPLYSVMPANLIPCCRDCNSEKLNAFAEVSDLQTLHPYFDDPKYFTQRWISARVIPGDPPILEFYVSPPAGWLAAEASRATAHFSEYRLGMRFGVEAAAEIADVIGERNTTLSDLSPADFAKHLQEKTDTSKKPINHWYRVMLAGLAADAWFCTYAHLDVEG